MGRFKLGRDAECAFLEKEGKKAKFQPWEVACGQDVHYGCILDLMGGLECSAKELELYRVSDGELLEVLDEMVT